MAKCKKRKAKEPMKPRFIFFFIAVIAFFAVFKVLGLGWVGSAILGLVLGGLCYFLFVVLKIQRLLKGKKESTKETAAHILAAQTAREIAQDGIVLLQNNDDLLPLPKGSRLNTVGLRCVQMSFNGGGSAASDESKCTSLEKALTESGFELNRELINLSCNYLKNQRVSIASPGKNYKVPQGNSQKGGAEFVAKPGAPVRPEISLDALRSTKLYPDKRTVLQHARDFSELALIVLSRGGGEGYDFDPADLRLIESEKNLIEETCKTFEKVILVLNTANTVEMGWLKDYPQIKSVIWLGFPGTSGNLALADILCGDVNPSGHLPDTWASSNMSHPAANNFCQLNQDGTWSKQSFHYENAPDKKGYFVNYSEGIYVGYRYFETRAAVDSGFDYDKEVIWPFGHGLSYTSFNQEISFVSDEGDIIKVGVSVRNEGARAGRCAVQCYCSAPYTGRIEKSAVQLIGFDKTELLAPGEEAKLELSICKRELAGFDARLGSWVLEAGAYEISLRSDAHNAIARASWELAEEVVFEGTETRFADAATDTLTRDFAPEHCAFTGPRAEDFTADESVLAALDFHIPTDSERGLTQMPTIGKKAGLKLSDMKDVQKSDEKWDTFVSQLKLSELCNLCGNGAWQTVAIKRLGVPATVAPDGSTSMGATVFNAAVIGSSKAGITWPCPSVLAASFDPAAGEKLGNALGREGVAMGYTGWYAPAMNCHRTAFNSRNFEYYSEDPLLAGKCAARVVGALQSHKIIPYIKHFALNERETNTRDQLYTWCSEQAIREIYLKPFEIAVREGKALGVMSSFNYIGHTWTGGSEALLKGVLRNEWGFEGMVVTDACLYPYMNVQQMVCAGGDLSLDTLGGLTGGNGKRRELLAAAQDSEYKISMAIALKECAKDILYSVCQTL